MSSSVCSITASTIGIDGSTALPWVSVDGRHMPDGVASAAGLFRPFFFG